MFRRILVGVDGSEPGTRAAATAAGLAHTYDGSIVLINVVQVSDIAAEAINASATEHLGDKPKRIMEKLSGAILDKAREVALAAGLPAERIETRSRDGNQAQQLVKAAKAEKADLVVVGSRGRGRLEGMLLGSVSQKLAALAPCPCLIVR